MVDRDGIQTLKCSATRFQRRRVLSSIAVVGALGVTKPWAAASQTPVTVGNRAPRIDVPDTEGRTRTFSEFAKKVVVLEWTSASCPFVAAQYESGRMQALQEWARARGVVWLSVLSTHPKRSDYLPAEQAKKFDMQRKAVPTALLLDQTGELGRRYGARTTPHMFIVDTTGNLVYAGAIDDKPTTSAKVVTTSHSFVRAALDDLAANRPVTVASTRPYGCSVGYA